MDNDGSWYEDELTWLWKKTNQWWRDGGRGLLSYSTDSGVMVFRPVMTFRLI